MRRRRWGCLSALSCRGCTGPGSSFRNPSMSTRSNPVSCAPTAPRRCPTMNCSDCSEKLDSYLDRELSNTEMLELQLHLEGCPPCAANYEFQPTMNRLSNWCFDQ